MEKGGGNNSETGSVMAKEKKSLVSMPTSPQTSGIKRRATS